MLIFLTGSAGLLGGALVEDLIRRGHAVIALVHRESEIRGNRGGVIPARPLGAILPDPGKVCVVRGDISRPDLGIEPKALALLQGHVECVLHCAALVKFEASFEDLHAVNVSGTRHVAMCFPDAQFVHVSTAYTCGLKDGPIGEVLHSGTGPFGNGYERSKAVSENELLEMRPDAIIARPSIVLGHHADGAIRSFDTIYRAFKFIAEGRIKQVPADPTATLNFVPIDHVVAVLAAMVEARSASPQIVHLAARQAFSVLRFLELIGSIPGLRSPHILGPDEAVQRPQGIAERLIQPYLAYFKRSPEFATQAAHQLIGKPAPIMDEAAMLRQFNYCVEAGFIRSRPEEACAAAE